MSTFDLNRIQRETCLRHVEYHGTLDSTNKLAAELLPNLQSLCPALVLTDTQTAGRGRGSNSWWANTGALTFSLVLKLEQLNLAPARLPLMSLATGVAVRNAIASLLPADSVMIKWPNDILVNESKVCGILTEQTSCDSQSVLIIGVGINVNNSLQGAPAEVRQRATSIYDITGHSYDLTTLLVNVLNAIDVSVRDLCMRPHELLAELNRRSLLNGRAVTLQVGELMSRGACSGIDENGALLLDTGSGPQAFVVGTIADWS